MQLLDDFSEDTVKIGDLEKIKKMQGFQEEMHKLTLKVK